MSNPASVPAYHIRRLPLWLLPLLLLLGAMAAGGWLVWQRLETATETLEAEDALIRRLSYQLRELEAQTEHLARRGDDSETLGQRTTEQLASLHAHQQSADRSVEALAETLRGGNRRFVLATVEELLLLAEDRLRLARDTQGAARALEQADARLARLDDPRLLPVREALAAERLALRAAPQADVAGAALSLGGLMARADSLPLATRAPERFEPPAEPARDELAPGAEWPERLWAGVTAAMSTVFRVQRVARPVDRLLPPQQEVLIGQLLLVKLEGARLALLRQETTAFRDLLDSTRQWLAAYYKAEDPAVLAAVAELERLRGLDLAPPLPETGRALQKLRALP